MKDQSVTRVLLGASSLLSNGAMLGPAGTAMVAALARARQIPVIVAAESYKFSEKVQLDSIVYNELGNSSEIAVMGSSGSAEEGAAAGAGGLVPVPQRQPGYRGAALAPEAVVAGRESAAEADPISTPTLWRSNANPNSGSGGGGDGSAVLPFNVVNLRYDLTPIGNISVVATETGLTPPTSVPVLMREIQSELLHAAGTGAKAGVGAGAGVGSKPSPAAPVITAASAGPVIAPMPAAVPAVVV